FHLAAALRGVAAGQGPLLVAPYDARLLSLTEAVSAQVDAFGARDLANFSWGSLVAVSVILFFVVAVFVVTCSSFDHFIFILSPNCI
ncbi:unnamed protein product, partial [Polarella glacialis]